MRMYELIQTGRDEWELRYWPSDAVDAESLYRGCMLGASEVLTYLEEPSTPPWAADVVSWEDHEIDAFLSRLAVRPPARRIDRIKRIVTLIFEGEYTRPRGVR